MGKLDKFIIGGKGGRRDNSVPPATRAKQFFYIVRYNWKQLVLLGVLVLLFSLPLYAVQFAEDMLTRNLAQELVGATEEKLAETALYLLRVKNVCALIDVAGLVIFSLGFSGIICIIKGYVWDENVHIGEYFKKGFKQNALQMLVLFFVAGALYAGCMYIKNLATVNSGVAAYFIAVPVGVFILFVLPVAGYTGVCLATYSGGIFQSVKIAFYAYVKTMFRAILAVICCVAIYIPQFIPDFTAHIFGYIFAALLSPLVILGWTEFCFFGLDRYVNADNFPEIVGKGLSGAE